VKPVPFDYHAPQTVPEAVELLARYGKDASPLAGGQSLVPMLALRLARPSALIDLNRVAGLSGVRVTSGMLCLGAMTRQTEVLRSREVADHAPLLIQALRFVGHPPTRARGTIGGSLAHADPAAELPAALLALDGLLVLRGVKGERTVKAGDFFQGPFTTAVAESELLIEILIPLADRSASAFVEIAPREGDFAVASAAVRLDFDGQHRCRAARVVLGAVSMSAPLRCAEAEERLVGRILDPSVISDAVSALPLEAVDFDTWLASRAYRQAVSPVLARRAVAAAAGFPEVQQ
jgi:aerobic carbon-monoxide dehydrogenase medium subunit